MTYIYRKKHISQLKNIITCYFIYVQTLYYKNNSFLCSIILDTFELNVFEHILQSRDSCAYIILPIYSLAKY